METLESMLELVQPHYEATSPEPQTLSPSPKYPETHIILNPQPYAA